ncbi:MAG: acyl carrier protein [Flavobacteriales bacterium]|nr:acyl carrier protein [Flavobacteriales bacterium]
MENFKTTMAEILEVDKISSEDDLDSFDAWDSLTILTIIAYCESDFNVKLSAEEIDNSETIIGLKELIKSKM